MTFPPCDVFASKTADDLNIIDYLRNVDVALADIDFSAEEVTEETFLD